MEITRRLIASRIFDLQTSCDTIVEVKTRRITGQTSAIQLGLSNMRGVARRVAEHSVWRHNVAVNGDAEARLMRNKEYTRSPTSSSRNGAHIFRAYTKETTRLMRANTSTRPCPHLQWRDNTKKFQVPRKAMRSRKHGP
jgi:hypothetical protein